MDAAANGPDAVGDETLGRNQRAEERARRALHTSCREVRVEREGAEGLIRLGERAGEGLCPRAVSREGVQKVYSTA